MRHLLATFISFFSILFLPFWLYLTILIVAVILIPFFWEGVLLALLIGLVHGEGTNIVGSIASPVVIGIFLLTALMIPLREKLRFHV